MYYKLLSQVPLKQVRYVYVTPRCIVISFTYIIDGRRGDCMVFHATGLFGCESDMERRQKKWQFWRTGAVQSAEASAIAVSACKCLITYYFGLFFSG